MEMLGKSLCMQASRLTAQRTAGLLPTLEHVAKLSCSTPAPQPGGRTEVNYEELSDMLIFNEDLALIDVRSPHELTKYGSIPGAVNIPLGEVKAAFQLSSDEFRDTFYLPKPLKNAKNLVFFARGPNASSAAVEIAHRLGYKRSRQYTGGWEDYCKKTGVPLTKYPSRRQEDVKKTSPFMGRPSFEAYNTYAF